MMSAPEEERVYTMEDIKVLPEGQRAELVSGRIYMMAPPKLTHELITAQIFRHLANHIEEKELGCVVLPSNAGVYIPNDAGVDFFLPDVKVVCDPSKLDEDGCKGAPDFIVEVLSKSTKSYDMVQKLHWYMDAGVKEYWIVDPMKRKVHVNVFYPEYDSDTFSFDEDVPVSICPGFSMNLGKMGF